MQKKPKYLAKATNIISKMGSLKFRPLLLAHIDKFIESDNGQDSWDEYSIYKVLVFTWLAQEEVKLFELGKDASRNDLLKACLVIAVITHNRGERVITEDLIQKLIRAYPEISNLEFMEIGGRSLLNKNCEGSFRFCHYSIQEFLLAYGIEKDLLPYTKYPIRGTNLMISFLLNCKDEVDFSKVNFESLSFKNMKFDNLNLEKISFEGCNLRGCSFKNCNLQSCNFTNSNLENVNISNANLQGANLHGASLKGAIIRGAKFYNTKFNNNTILPDGSPYNRVSMQQL